MTDVRRIDEGDGEWPTGAEDAFPAIYHSNRGAGLNASDYAWQVEAEPSPRNKLQRVN